MSKVYAVLPIKRTSTGLPNKNFRMFHGKPMYEWVLEECLKSRYIDKVYVSTSWEDFGFEIIKQYPQVGFIKRPATLNGEVELMRVVQHSAKMIGDKSGVYMQVQINKPLTTVKDLDELLEAFNLENADSLFTVQKIDTALNGMFQHSRQSGFVNYKSCAIAKIWRYKNLMNAGDRSYGMGLNHINYFIGKHHIEIDDEVDFEIAHRLFDMRNV